LQAARDAARGRLVAFGAGLFAAGALIYTARNFTLSRRTFELTEQGQVTDRYTKAIEQLGSDKGLDVRIGGIYALERIARDSPRRDHPTIMEVLAAFIRDRSREQWPPAEPHAKPPEQTTRPDVQAAATVIGRRDTRYDTQAIDLHGANLPHADLTFADLISARLHGARLNNAHITGAHLNNAHLNDAHLNNAHLNDAGLVGAHLNGAHLNHADLTGAYLHLDPADADFGDRVLFDVDPTDDARFLDADLTGADLTGADLTGAVWPPHAAVPEGWQRDTDSGRLKRANTDADGTATD
jgi:hypothetical protein